MTDAPQTASTPAAQFSPGDVVRLKSGGPKMTVLKLEDETALACKWFDRNGKVHKDSFPPAMVEIFVKQW